MSLKDQIAADVSAVFLNTADFADAITRYPAGVVASAESIPAAVFEELTAQEMREQGIGVGRRGRLWLPATVNVDGRDRWLIAGETWETESWNLDGEGFCIVDVKRTEKELTTKSGGRVL